MMHKHILILCAAMLAAMVGAQAQTPTDSTKTKRLTLPSLQKAVPADGPMKTFRAAKRAKEHYTFATVLDGDTVPLIHLREVKVYSSGMMLTAKEIRNNAKLIRNVRLMLPYAREAKRRLDILEVQIANMPKKERKAALKRAEKELTAEYKEDLKKRTFSQGLVLIKLIDRETNRTAYSLVGELRGTVRAGVYQAFARLFGYNLKTNFDPKNDKKDNLIDRIVVSIDRGQL